MQQEPGKKKTACYGQAGGGEGSFCSTLMGKNLQHQFVSGGEEGEGGEGPSVVCWTRGPFEELQPFSTRTRMDES